MSNSTIDKNFSSKGFNTNSHGPVYFNQFISDNFSTQLSDSLNTLQIIEDLKAAEFEKDLLFSICEDISHLKDQRAILATVSDRLKILLPVKDIMITMVGPHQNEHFIFLKSFEEKHIHHADFEHLFNSHVPFDDGLIDEIMSADEPINLSVHTLSQYEANKAYTNFYRDNKICQILGVSMFNEGEELGAVYMTSKMKTPFSADHLKLVKTLSVYFAMALSNFKAKNCIAHINAEHEGILEINNEIAMITDKESLLISMSKSIRKLIPFNDISITLYNHDSKTHSCFLNYSEAKRVQHPDFEKARAAHSPMEDGIVNKTFESDDPVIFAIDDLLQNPIVPLYIDFYSRTHIREFVGVSMSNKDGIYGGLYIFSENDHTYHPKQFNLIKGIANQISNTVANILAYDELLEKEKEKTILLNISDDITTIKNKDELLCVLHQRLNTIFCFDHIAIRMDNPSEQKYCGYNYDSFSPCKDHPEHNDLLAGAFPLDGVFHQQLLLDKSPRVINIENLKNLTDSPDYIRISDECGMKEIVYVQLRYCNDVIGSLILVSANLYRFTLSRLDFLQGVCHQLSNAITTIMANDEIRSRENEKSRLLTMSNDLAAVRNRKDLHQVINKRLNEWFSYNYIQTMVVSGDEKWVSTFLSDRDTVNINNQDYRAITTGHYPIHDGILDFTFEVGKPVVFDLNKMVGLAGIPDYLQTNYSSGMRELVLIGLTNGHRKTGLLAIFTDQNNQITNGHLNFIHGISSQLAIAMANIIANEKIEQQVKEISEFKKQLEVENIYLQEEILTTNNYSEIIGQSPALQKVFKLMSSVAPTSSSVLILGETGTGKELIARAIHNASPRKDKVMVKVNCAAMPANLIESELFGHEKGSFTGATDKRIGKFELANNSTLFLDEIGDMPLDLQVKLLRALQEKEIERVGGRGVIKIDVRIIAATNRDLEKEVMLGNFRSDLYFRLNVFPILIPPLRERKQDISILAAHFLAKHSKKAGKKVIGFASNVLKELAAYSWPGNVRELEHLIERSILLTSQQTIKQIDIPANDQEAYHSSRLEGYVKTIDEMEREHIMNVLNSCNGKVAGRGGAAEVLRIPSTTLNSKIKKLGIKKEYMG